MRADPSTRRPRAIAASVLALCTLALGVLIASPPQAAAADQPSAKVKAVLDLLASGAAPQAFRDAIAKAKFTKPEAAELVRELEKPSYEAALRSLRQRAENEPRAAAAKSPAPRGLDAQALRETLQREQTARIARLQPQALAALQEARAMAAAAPYRPNLQLMSRMSSLASARAPVNDSPVRISGTDPERGITGVVLVVLGSHLGSAGDVTIIVGAEDPRPENAFDCRIIGWGREAIHIAVPEAIEDLHRSRPFPNGRRSALLWVRPAGDNFGRTRQIEITLNPDHFTPVIETVSPAELTPGLRFAIRGQNLSAGSEPRVEITSTLTNRRATLRTLGHSSGWVEAYVPDDLSGFRAGQVRLVVSNGLEESQPKSLVFTPAEDVVTIRSSTLRASCFSLIATVLYGPGTTIDSLCVWGEEKREIPFGRIDIHDASVTRLANDWTVASMVTTEVSRSGNGAGCYIEDQPSAGSTEFRSAVLVAWANGYCNVTCQATLTVRGPRGVSPAP